jgi:uncharacterized protein (TIGR02145 family)
MKIQFNLYKGVCLTSYCVAIFLLISCNSRQVKEYETIRIGNQDWMQYNLDESFFRNGDSIPYLSSANQWAEAGEKQEPGWCYYDNNPENGKRFGKLYNWYAVNDSRGIAPEGWHVPTDEEWTVLIDYLGGEEAAGPKLKSIDSWMDYEGEIGAGTNESGFSGLPNGFRNASGVFSNIETTAYWWSASESNSILAWDRILKHYKKNVFRYNYYKKAGFGIRCVKDIN